MLLKVTRAVQKYQTYNLKQILGNILQLQINQSCSNNLRVTGGGFTTTTQSRNIELHLYLVPYSFSSSFQRCRPDVAQ